MRHAEKPAMAEVSTSSPSEVMGTRSAPRTSESGRSASRLATSGASARAAAATYATNPSAESGTSPTAAHWLRNKSVQPPPAAEQSPSRKLLSHSLSAVMTAVSAAPTAASAPTAMRWELSSVGAAFMAIRADLARIIDGRLAPPGACGSTAVDGARRPTRRIENASIASSDKNKIKNRTGIALLRHHGAAGLRRLLDAADADAREVAREGGRVRDDEAM
eukprot:scaffold5310_cov114-Isochrysis_galbana.AAC.8